MSLGTVNKNGEPEMRVMLNLHNPMIAPHLLDFLRQHGSRIYFTANNSSDKIKQIEYNKKSSVYFIKPESYQGLLLVGETRIIRDLDVKNAIWSDDWLKFYPNGRGGGDYSAMEFTPISYKYYDGKSKIHKGLIANLP